MRAWKGDGRSGTISAGHVNSQSVHGDHLPATSTAPNQAIEIFQPPFYTARRHPRAWLKVSRRPTAIMANYTFHCPTERAHSYAICHRITCDLGT